MRWHDLVYIFSQEDFDRLDSIKTRLYDGTTLTYDMRRDLAKVMEAILEKAVAIDANIIGNIKD